MGLKDFIPAAPEKFFTKGTDGIVREDDNTMNAIVEIFSDDFNKILGDLASRNMKPGKFVGGGRIGVAFELETLDGKKIDSALIRFDPENAIHSLDSVMAIDPVVQFKNETFKATIVPRGDPSQEPTKEEIKTTLEIFNAEGALLHLQDMKPDQFMKVPGIEGAVLTDMGSVRPIAYEEGQVVGQGGVRELSEKLGLDYEQIKTTKASPELVEERRAQKEAVSAAIKKELVDKGVNLEDVPTIQKISTLQQTAARDAAAAR